MLSQEGVALPAVKCFSDNTSVFCPGVCAVTAGIDVVQAQREQGLGLPGRSGAVERAAEGNGACKGNTNHKESLNSLESARCSLRQMASVVFGVCMAGLNAPAVGISGYDSLFLHTRPLSRSLEMLSTATLFLIPQ